MNNYEYIIASLPEITQDGAGTDADAVIEAIRGQLDGSDAGILDFLLSGFDPSALCADFYRSAAKSRSRFVREFFAWDRNVRNAKVLYLNRALGRPEMQDVLLLDEDEVHGDFEDSDKAEAALGTDGILERERALDNLMWEKSAELTMLDIFSLDMVLSFIVRLKTADRWSRLDPETGKRMLRSLVEEIRKTK